MRCKRRSFAALPCFMERNAGTSAGGLHLCNAVQGTSKVGRFFRLTSNRLITIMKVTNRLLCFGRGIMAISNDDILDVSLALFSQNGYDGTSLQDIADRLKVTKGALFKHYESKEALWNALIDKVERYYGDHFGKVQNIPLPNTLEELRKLTLRQVDFTLHDETVKKVRKLLTLGQFRNERMSDLATKHFSGDIEAIYMDIFRHLMENGKVKADNSSLLALDYTAPITILIHLCDREPENEEKITKRIQEHIEHFLSVYGNNNPSDDNTAETVSGMTLKR